MFKKIVLILIAGFLILFPVKNAFANTLYLSPSGGNISPGKVFSVQVKLQAGNDKVNAISAFLNYPSDKLDVAWIKYDTSAFIIEAESEYGNGVIKISRGNFSGVGGNANIATIGFIGKSSGQALVSFIEGSAAPRESDSSDSLNLGSSKGGLYNVGSVSKSNPKAKLSNILGEFISEEAIQSNKAGSAAFVAILIVLFTFLIVRKKK